ncbi:oxysterol-binding protein-related protein 10 isoform X5 [Paramormyrops kingsleyae]|uniref:oxysterol-binding protein-related protein 10 isoform X5 n=1 Tax=Paramormyrops kingsleyae TaxID=1676925 RepID=UPI000CD63931|nr:oxysterol-binding protein-related protein 10 isoform X4 [Paramormyrops kingsleyae]
MEKACGVHSGAHKSGPGSTSSDRGNSTKKLGRSGSHTPSSGAGSGSASSPAGGGGSRAGTAGNSGSMQQPNRRHLEGVLSKYTNLLQGWQNRYFVLDPELEQLQYFVNEHSRTQKPRGWLPLAGASVTPSDEAPHMFTIYSASGELYKLRASDAKEQQFWMSQLQACARRHSDGSTRIMSQAEGQQKTLVQSIESLPTRGPLSSLDQDLLLLKATSAATLSCLGECLNILQQSACQNAHGNSRGPPTVSVTTCCTLGRYSQAERSHRPANGVPGWLGPKSPSAEEQKNDTRTPVSWSAELSPALRGKGLPQDSESPSPETAHPDDEVTDTEDNEEEDLGVLDEQRSVILHLLSQLKLGMDLTRVVLPTFILEKRSLLEMYANFMAHPDMFLAITAACSAEERMVRFVEYYLTAFHEGRRGAVAKKPYNPVLGETFHCSWEVPRERVRPLQASRDAASSDCYRVHFVAEQVSHHPPVSGFYCECRERGMCVNAHVWTKSKFMGMSVGVSMVGEGVLYLLEHGEEYVFTLPSAYARSILTVPWVELGGKVSVVCAKSGYSASVTFHTKPFYGGKVHRVTAEVKHNPTNTIICKAQGEWNGMLEFTYSSGETKAIDTSKLPVIKKKIRPLEKQGQHESRRLWRHVTAALKDGNMDSATEHKRRLEERQRTEERQRADASTPWKPKHFVKEGEGWVYHNPLWKAH